MLKQSLLLTLILWGLRAACPPGCSKCIQKDSEFICEICDLSRFYYLNEEGKCELNELPNCKVSSPSADSKLCVQCQDDHFFDELAQECATVPDSKKDENCSVYSLVADCLRCKPGHIVQSGKCVEPSNQIANCQFQISEEHCEVCDSGYQLNLARTTCLSFSTVNNCKEHQEFLCERCKSDYSLAYNWHLLSQVSLGNLQSSLEADYELALMIGEAKEDCVKNDDVQCVEYNNYGRCKTCRASYHPDPVSGKCVLSQEPEIFKCKKYSNVSTCAECDKGFYLTSNKCVERKLVDNCEKYTVDSDGCEECSDGFYSAGSSCLQRNSSANINYCTSYEAKADACAACDSDYLLSTDKLKCFQKISFCKTHLNAASTATLFCEVCEPGAVPKTNANTPPDIEDCEMRDNEGCVGWEADNSNKCTTCLTGFYWLDESNGLNLCEKYTKTCKEYELKSDNCSSCFGDEYLEDNSGTKTCKPYTVRNCKVFEDAKNECKECNTGYYLSATTKECQAYTLVNCKEEEPEKNECKTCDDNHYAADKITCLPNDLQECATPGADNTCTTCNPGFHLVSGKCFSGTQTGCDPTKYTSNKDECTQCLEGYYLKDSKYCLPYTVDNCAGTTNNGFLPTEDGCEDCLPGFFKYNDTGDANNPKNKRCFRITIPNCVKSENDGTACTECAAGYEGTSECMLQYIPHCKEYSTTVKQCSKCVLGYKLSAGSDACTKIEIPNCKTFTENTATCADCETGFQADSTSENCLKTDVVGCSTYTAGVCTGFNTEHFYLDTNEVKPKMPAHCKAKAASGDGCTECIEGYKLNSTTCERNTTNNCEVYGVSTGECVQCEKGYFLKDGASFKECQKYTPRTNCLRYDSSSDACILCEAGYYLDTPACKAMTFSNASTFNCWGNSGNADDSAKYCSDCQTGYKKVTIGTDALTMPLRPGVLTLQKTGDIGQLAEGYYTDGSDPVRDLTNDNCLQLVAFTTAVTATAIDAAGKCLKCRYPEQYFNDSFTCTKRTAASFEKCSTYNLDKDECIACKEGLEYGSPVDCTEGPQTSTTNCKYTKFGTNGCYECYDGFLVDQKSNALTCAANTGNLKGCKEFNTDTPSECKICQEHWYLNKTDNVCFQPENCMLASSGALGYFCKFCKPGFKPDPASKYKCITAEADDICALYENEDIAQAQYKCIKCKEPGTIAHNFLVQNNYQFRCVKNIYKLMNESYVVIQNPNVFIFAIDLPEKNYGIVKDQKEQGAVLSSICLPLVVPNCRTYDLDVPFTPCTACDDGFYLLANGQNGQECMKGGLGGCKVYSSFDSCATCEPGWKLTDKTVSNATKKICTKVVQVPYCEVQKPDAFECIKCAPGFLLYQNMCYKQNYTNCKYYDFEQESCFGCEKDFYLSNGTCHGYSELNCVEYHRLADLCVQCPPDYYLYNGTCRINTSLNCLEKSTLADYCLSCEPGYYLNLPVSDCGQTSKPACFDPVCLPNVSTNCQIHDQESPDCLVCESGYYLNQGQCNPYTVQNCLLKDAENDRCEFCREGYYLNGLGSCEQYTVQNCQIMEPNLDLCIQCNAGYYRIAPGACIAYTVKNCNVYHKFTNACMSCLPGHYKSFGDDCVKYTKTANCQQVDPSRDFCFTCKPGYYNDFGECVRYTVNNCALFKPDANLCTTCKDGYFLNKNSCESYTVRCEQYSRVKNECLSCPFGYYLDGGICYVNNGLFCKEQSAFRNGCKSCLDDFYLDDGQCKIREKSLNCKETMETADLCKSCQKTHYIAGGMCISYARNTCKTFNEKKDLCMECETNKYWMSHNVCESYTVENCKTYSPTADKCTECEKGEWYLDTASGMCVKSTHVEKCDEYSNTQDECTLCEDGFYLASSSECRRNPSGLYQCIEYSDENACSKCALGFFLDNNYCQKSKTVIDKCIHYSADGVCETCNSSYLLIENKCIEKVETSCAEWVDADNCSKCPPNFVLKDSDSSKKICEDSGLADCVEAEFGSPTNLCTKCAEKKILHNDACQDPVSPLAGCKVYVKEGECSECDDGYTLTKSGNGCVSNYTLMPANCAFGIEQSSPKCRVCMSGHHLNDNRDCVSCGGDGCNVCDPYDSTKCIFCEAGYDHNGSTCTKAADSGQSSNRMMHPEASVSRQIGWIMALVGLLFVTRSG